MSVDTRVHITGDMLQERAVLRRTLLCSVANGRYARRKSLAIQGHTGDEIRVSLDDLGTALRVLKVSPTDLGYKR